MGFSRHLEWVAISFSKGSSQSRDWTRDSCIAGRFFTHWATRETRIWAHPSITGSQPQFGSKWSMLSWATSCCQVNPQPLLWSPLHSSAMASFPSYEFPTALVPHHTGEVKTVCPDWLFPGISSLCLCRSRFDSQTHFTDCEIKKLSYATQLGCGSGKGNLTVTFVSSALYG